MAFHHSWWPASFPSDAVDLGPHALRREVVVAARSTRFPIFRQTITSAVEAIEASYHCACRSILLLLSWRLS